MSATTWINWAGVVTRETASEKARRVRVVAWLCVASVSAPKMSSVMAAYSAYSLRARDSEDGWGSPGGKISARRP